MSTNKKFRIQNGVDVTGELTVNDVVIIRADGTIVAGAIADAVSSLVDEGALTGSGSSIVDSDSQIFIDVNSNTVAIASETATRISDIASLQTQIDSLGVNSDTQAEVDSLQTQIDSIVGASPETLDTLVEIVSAFEGADSDIQTLLATNSSSLIANTDAINANTLAINAETSLRQDADDLLQQNIDAEVARATAAEQANAAAISAEAIARADEITSLQSASFTYNDSDGWSGDLVPSADNEYALGSPDRVWKDLYIGPGSLYINGTKILEDNSGTITMYADAGQNLSFGATGGGNIDLNAGEESVQLKSDLVMSVGETISTVGGAPTKFGGAVDMGTHKVKNVGVPVDETDAATKKYVDDVNAQGTISGDKVFEDNVKIEGNLTVEGTTTTLDSQTLKVADNIIDLNSNVSTGAPVLNAGIRIMRGDEPAVQLRWNELEDRWEVYDGVTATPIAVESSDVITEGSNNLFFTVVRAREAVSQDIADAVAAEATARGAAIDAEIARATSAEQANAAAIAAETTAREDAVTAEETARIAGDATVQASVDAEQAARIAGDLSEAQARAAAVSDLQSQLNSVTGTDLSALQSQLDAIVGTSPETLDTIQEVVAAFEGADSDLTSLITGNSSTITAINASLTQEVSDRTFAVLAEKQQRESADDALQSSIDTVSATVDSNNTANANAISTETAARIAGDQGEAATREAAITAEATARVAGDATVQAAVDAEAARATAAEQANATAISAEETRALAAESDLQGQINQIEATGATHPLFSTMADLPDASANHGMFAHVHAEGAAFFAHGGQWVRLANMTDLASVDLSSIQSQIDAILGSSPETLDTLQEIVAAFESADGDLQTLMTTNSSSISTLDAFVGDGAPVNLVSMDANDWIKLTNADDDGTFASNNAANNPSPNILEITSTQARFGYQTVHLSANTTYTLSFKVSGTNFQIAGEMGFNLNVMKEGTPVWPASSSNYIDNAGFDFYNGGEGTQTYTFYNDVEQDASFAFYMASGQGTGTWVFEDMFLGDPSEVVSLDTSASTVVGAINELHAEMADNSAVTSSIQSETDARIAADTAEQTARQTADTANANAIINETNIRSAADAAETSARISADNALDAKITAEESARQAQDTVLSSQISTESSRLDIEISNRTNVDTGLQTQIDDIVADNAARTASGATIAEVNAVQSSLDAEVVRAQLAEQANASAIVTGDAALQAQLDAIVGTSPETLDTLQEIVTAYSNADGTLQGLITANTGAIAQLQTTIGAEGVPLITPDIGETITYDVEYAGRQYYAVADNTNVHVYDSVDPSTPVAKIYGIGNIRFVDSNSEALFVNATNNYQSIFRYEWSDLVLGITSWTKYHQAAGGQTVAAMAVSEEYIYAYETSGTDQLHKQPLSSSGSSDTVMVYNENGLSGHKLRVFGDKLYSFDYDNTDRLIVWDIRASDGYPINAHSLTSGDQNSDAVLWGSGDQYGSFEASSTLIAVGAPYDDMGGVTNAGSVYLFNPDNLNEAHTKLYPPAEYDVSNMRFGWSVAVTDTRLIVGATDSNNLASPTTGSNGYIFIYDATNLLLPPLVVEPPAANIGAFTQSMLEESNRLLVRSSAESGVYVYDLTNMDQPPVHLVEPTTNTASGTFGSFMAISPAATVTQSITDTIIPAQGLGNSINYLESKRQELRADLEANLAAIQSNDADIASIAADVATNTANIATNAAAIVAVNNDRTAFEASVNADRQSHRDAVQADIDQVNADRTSFEASVTADRQTFEDTVNASQAQFIADHDSDYSDFTTSVSGTFADTNLLQNEIRGRMGTGHIALPQETTSISYNKDVGDQYYTVIEGNDEFFVYTSAEYVENQSVQVGLGTRVVLPSTYDAQPQGNFITRDHVIVMARVANTSADDREIYFLVYELATIDSSSLPIAEVHADLRYVYDFAHIRYDGGSKVLIGNVSLDSVAGSAKIYDVPSLVAGNAVFIETTSEDLPAGVNYPTVGQSGHGNFAYRVDWNDTHVFVGSASGEDKIFVYDRTDLSYVTTLQDSIYGGGDIGYNFVVSNTMVVAVQQVGSHNSSSNHGRMMVWDASNLNAAPVYLYESGILNSAVFKRTSTAYYMYYPDRKLAVSDDWIVFGSAYEVVMIPKENALNNDFPYIGVNSSSYSSNYTAVQSQFKGIDYNNQNFSNIHAYTFDPSTWGSSANRNSFDYPSSIQIQNDKLIITSRNMRMSSGTSEDTGTVYIHDLNNFTDLVNGVEGVNLQLPVMIEESGFTTGNKLPAVSATGTITQSVTETFNPNDSLTAAVNYLNAKKEELLTAVEAVTGSSTLVQDLQTIESNIDFKLLAQDQRYDSDKAEQIAIYDAANAEQSSIYDSANAAHVAYFEQYTSGETAARESADANLQSQITSNDGNISSLQSQIDTIVGSSPESLNTLQEVVSYFENADDNLAAIITSNETKVNSLLSSLDEMGVDAKGIFGDDVTTAADASHGDIFFDRSTGKIYKGVITDAAAGNEILSSGHGTWMGTSHQTYVTKVWLDFDNRRISDAQPNYNTFTYTFAEPINISAMNFTNQYNIDVTSVTYEDGTVESLGVNNYVRPIDETRKIASIFLTCTNPSHKTYGWSYFNGITVSTFDWEEITVEMLGHVLLANAGDDQVREELMVNISTLESYADLVTPLDTSSQTLTGAINELKIELDPISNPSLTTAATDVVGAINELNTAVQSITGSDTQFLDDIATNQTDIATLQSDLVTTNSTAAVIRSDLTTESSARHSGDANLQSQIDTLTSTQTSNKSDIEVSLANEVARATVAENTLQANIDAEELRALTAESVNAAAVVTEKTRAQAIEAGLAADIAVENVRAQAAEVQLANHIGANFTNGSITVSGLATFNGGLYFGDGTGTIGFSPTGNSLQVLSDLDLMGNRLVNYNNPVDSGDIANKSYVDETTQAVSDRIDTVLSGSGALDTIVEVVAAFENADSDIQALITSNSTSVTANTDAINAEVAARQQAILDEASARIAGDSDLSNGISNEIARATAAEGVLTLNLSDEISRATAAEASLVLDIANESLRATAAEGVNAQAISAETTRATTVEASLAQDIADEALRAQGAEAVLTSDVSTNATAISNLQSQVAGVSTSSGSSTIEMTAEVDMKSNKVTGMADPTAAQDAATKSYVDASVATEATSRTTEDTSLQSNIDAANARIDAILNGSVESLDTVVEVVSAFEGADSNIQNLITANASTISQNATAIATEATARANADSDETALRTAADAVLTADLAAEVARAQAAESAETVARANADSDESVARVAGDADLQSQIDTLSATQSSDKSLVDGDVAAETARATAAESALQSAIDAEEVARTNADSDETALRTAADAVLTANLASEVARAQSAESAESSARVAADSDLQTQIDFIKENTDPAALDSLTELVSAFQNADSDVASVVASNASAIAATNARTAGISVDSDSNIELSVGIEMGQNNIKDVNDIYAARGFIDTVESNDLKVQTGTVDFEGSLVNFGSSTVFGNGIDNRIKSEFDNHINVSTANAGEFVKWTGTDYEWVELLQGRLATDQLQVDTGGSIAFMGPGGTLDVQDATVVFSGSDVRMPTPTDAGQGANKGYVDDADSDLNASLSTAISNEESRATTAEGVLTTNLSNEISRATSAEATLASDISAEETRALAAEAAEASARTDADSDLQSAIDAEVARATAAEGVNAQAIVDETSSRTSADTTLQSNIDTVSGRVDAILNGSSESLDTIVEVVAAFENADSDLQTLISSNAGSHTANAAAITAEETRALAAEGVLQSAVNAEETRATGVESGLQSQITSETAARSAADQSMKDDVDSDIAAEAALRSAGDATLQSAVDVEVARATAAEGVLQSLLDSEQSARLASDQALQSAVTAEENARVAADAVLQSAIDAEVSARTSADNTLQSNIDAIDAAVTAITNGSPETLNQLVEVVAAFEDADSDIQTLISTLGGDASALTTRVSTLESEMDATETATSSNASAISAETSARVAAVQANADAITAEATARAAAITAEQNARSAAIVASESDRDSADADLQSQIDALSAEETAGKSSLQFQLTQEELARIAGDSDLTDSLAAEVARATAAESGLSSDIVAETSRATTAESSLQTQIDSILSNTDATALNSLAEIVTEFQSVDGTLTGLISSNGSRISALESGVTAIEGWTTDNLSEGTINKYWTEQRTKDCLTGGLCISYNSTTGEISIDEAEAATSLTVAESHDANALGGEAPSHYRINVYDAAGNLVN